MQELQQNSVCTFTKVVLGLYFAYAFLITAHTVLPMENVPYRQATEWTVPYLGWSSFQGFMFSVAILLGGMLRYPILLLITLLSFMLIHCGIGLIDGINDGYLFFKLGIPLIWAILIGCCLYIELRRRLLARHESKLLI